MSHDMERFVDRALEHVRHLAVTIGPRPSTREGEREAARYAARVLKEIGVQNVREEVFSSGRETYWPYALALGAGLLGNLLYLRRPNRRRGVLAAVLNALGAWAFYAEANFEDHWGRRVLPKGVSQNVVGVIPPREDVRRRVVLVSHLDSHRTPLFYRSPLLLRLFSTLVGAAFVSLPLSAVVTLLRALGAITGAGVLVSAAAAFQAFAFSLSVQGQTTPHTPGANDNASGVATVLALAERLVAEPLTHTEVWIVLTGCEEVGAYGIDAFLKAHGHELRQADFINIDMVGVGLPAILTREGLIRSYRPHPELLRLALEIAAEHPEWNAGPHTSGAYTDMGVIVKHGFRGLVIDSVIPPGHPAEPFMGYWHQMRDTADNIERACLSKVHAFAWELLQRLDRQTHTTA